MLGKRKCSLSVFGVPLDLSTFGHRPGAKEGPDEIRKSGFIRRMEGAGWKIRDEGNIKIPKPVRQGSPLFRYAREIFAVALEVKEAVGAAIDAGDAVLILGGDHTVSLGSIAGVLSRNKNVGVLWIDAHPDLNTPETTTSGNIHGMVLAGLLGKIARFEVKNLFRGGKLPQDNLALIGLRNIDPAEENFISAYRLNVFTVWDIERDGIEAVLNAALDSLPDNVDHLHVSFDLDVIDKMWAPGVGIRTYGGINYRETIYLARKLGRLGVDSLDIVELNPKIDKDKTTLKLAAEIICAFYGLDYGPYERFREKRRRPASRT